VTAPVFLLQPLPDAAELSLSGAEGRHAATVRRLRVGERVDVTDGTGGVARCVVAAVARDQLELDVQQRESLERPTPRLTVIQALIKGERSELAADLLTEVGVDEIVPWQAERSMAKWVTGRSERRWEQAVAEAAKQSRRYWWPVVADAATSTREVEKRLAQGGCAFVLHEAASLPLVSALRGAEPDRDVTLVVGPEGGLSDAEIAAFETAGASLVRLGHSVLRSSAAGCAAATLVLAAMGRWN